MYAPTNGAIRMIHMDAQLARLLIHLQDFKLASRPLDSATGGSKYSHSRQKLSNQPSPLQKPRGIAV
jgi:hypothetical protein